MQHPYRFPRPLGLGLIEALTARSMVVSRARFPRPLGLGLIEAFRGPGYPGNSKYFRGLLVSASLKRSTYRDAGCVSPHFRGLLVSASLKRGGHGDSLEEVMD